MAIDTLSYKLGILQFFMDNLAENINDSKFVNRGMKLICSLLSSDLPKGVREDVEDYLLTITEYRGIPGSLWGKCLNKELRKVKDLVVTMSDKQGRYLGTSQMLENDTICYIDWDEIEEIEHAKACEWEQAISVS